jgi:hypothetical protein
MCFNSLYRASWQGWWWHADGVNSFWRLLGDGSREIADAYHVFMEHRDVLNQVVSLGLHIGENDMSDGLVLAYKLNWATQQLCIAFRDAIVVPALWEAKRRREMAGQVPEGPALRDALLQVCSEMFGPAFSGSGHEDLMLLAVGKRFNKVEMAGEHTGQPAIRPFASLNAIRLTPSQRMHRGHRRRHNRDGNDPCAYMSGSE